MWPFGKAKPVEVTRKKSGGIFSTDGEVEIGERKLVKLPDPQIPLPTIHIEGLGMDDNGDGSYSLKFNLSQACGVPEAQIEWYGLQSFIGYQLCAILAQHWLVAKACAMPGRDAVRNGYELSVDDGSDIDVKIIAAIKKADKKFKIKKQLQDFANFGRVFGIRHALFKVDSPDPEYYAKPFNIDGVLPGSYRGIKQIDPYWITPELTSQNLVNPGSEGFYEPEYWRVNGMGLIHKSHLCIFRTGEVADILKPSYFYGGVSIPQRIYERIYAAERSANEAPMLLLTKRLTIMYADLSAAIADPQKFAERMQWWTENRDNWGVKICGEEEKIDQKDTALTEVDNVIMTQYQIVAAISEVPGTKMMGTQPKGFNSTGDYEESSYHEMLESMEENDLTPLLDKHYELVVQSVVKQKFPDQAAFEISVNWNELDAMTAAEQAEVNATKATTGLALIQGGVIDSQIEHTRIVNDKNSGYSGMPEEVPPMPDDPNPDGPADNMPQAGGGAVLGQTTEEAAAAGAAKALPHPPRPKAPAGH
jgi:phage-related protein (TIGR01555 family)